MARVSASFRRTGITLLRHSSRVAVPSVYAHEKDVTLSNQAIIDAVQRGDWDVINAVPPEPGRLIEDFERVMATLKDEGSQLATILARRYPSAASARFMLTMAQSTHLQAAVEAARAVDGLPTPPGAVDIANTVRNARSATVRAQLYLALGHSRDVEALTALQQLLTTEGDSEASAKGTAAAARLGGVKERATFLMRVTNASATTAKTVYDDLLYVGDVRFSKGLLTWLDRYDPVTRVGSDANKSARMCDLAVWTAMRLGVKLPTRSDKLDVYDPITLQAARTALAKLADP